MAYTTIDDPEAYFQTLLYSGNDSSNNDNMSLPEVFEVRRDEWERFNFDGESALRACYNGETWDFWVNMDNIALKYELKTTQNHNISLLEARFKYGLTLFSLSVINDNNKSDNDNNDIEETILSSTKSLAKVLLPVISSLGELEIEEETVLAMSA